MSGYKHATVTISESEYRRLHDADMQGRFSHVAFADVKREQKENELLRAAVRSFEERQHEFQEYIGVLENEIGQVEVETAQVLMDQEGDLAIRLASLEEDTARTLDEVVQDLSAQIESSQMKHANQLARMKKHLNLLSEDGHRKADIAENWLYSTVALRDFIEKHYDHNRFLPGQFQRIDIQIQQARENLQEGMPEAALLGAQKTYTECSQSRLELERRIREWQVMRQKALGLVERLYQIIAASNSIPALDINGRELSIMIDLDHWSNHGYETLLQQVKGLQTRLRRSPQSFTTADLKDIVENTIPEFDKEFDEIVYSARLAVIYSQIRINIADITIQALGKQGFVVDDHGFSDDDMRKPYFVTLRNIEGSRVTININPIRSVEASNDLVIESNDNQLRTESELRSRSQEILQSLVQFGLHVGPISTKKSQSTDLYKSERLPARALLRQDSIND